MIKGKKIVCNVCGGDEWKIKHMEMKFDNGEYDDIIKMVDVLTCSNCKKMLFFNDSVLPINLF